MEKELWKGNEAVAEAAIRAGCKYFFGYPITPQNEIPEYLSLHLPQVGGCFIQAESEVAAINMVYGAAGCGVRVMTSSSSPGISLKQEGITYMCGAELPAVIVNMMRGGPGLGTIQPAQGDYYQATRGGRQRRLPSPGLRPRHHSGGCGLCPDCLRCGRLLPQPRHGPGRRHDRPDDGSH